MCNCNNKTYEFSMCCTPRIADASNFYTKGEVDEIIEELEISGGCCITSEEVDDKISEATSGLQETLIPGDNITISGNVISAEVPSLSGYATEQWVLDKHYISGVDLSDYALKSEIPTSNSALTNDMGYLTEHQPIKTVNHISLIGEGNVEIGDGGNVDLSNYYTKTDVNNLIADMASKTWVSNQEFALNSSMIQLINNLQDQIDSLKSQISGCCISSGETEYRWITMTGENDYTCSGTTKMTKEKQQSSTDGGNTWTDTGQYRTGDTILEENCMECGYIPPMANLKYKGDYNTGESKYVECDGVPSLTVYEIQNDVPTTIDNLSGATFGACCEYIPNDALEMANNIKQIVLEDGVLSIGQNSFMNSSGLTSANIPNSVQFVDNYSFANCSHLSALTIGSGITYVGQGAFSGCTSLTNNVALPNVEKIMTGAFRGCSGIQSVNIGTGCTRIEGSAFRGCTGLSSITINAVIPPDCAPYAFDDTNNCPIYVPSASVEAYKAKYAWSEYSARIQAIQ